MYKNLCEKYGLTVKEIESGINVVSKNLGKITDVTVMIAVTELLCGGDIPTKIEPASSANETSSKQ